MIRFLIVIERAPLNPKRNNPCSPKAQTPKQNSGFYDTPLKRGNSINVV